MESELKSGEEYRRGSKKRVQVYREKMKANGFKAITVFISTEFHAELERLKADEGLTREAAIDAIFQGYNKSRNVTCNNNLKNNNVTSNDTSGISIVTCAEIDDDGNLISENMPTEDPPETVPDWQDKDNYKAWLMDKVRRLKTDGLTFRQIAAELERQGLKTLSGKSKWHPGTIGKWV